MRTSRHACLRLLCCLLSYALLSNAVQLTQSAAAGGTTAPPRVNPYAAYGQSNNASRGGNGRAYVPPALRHDNDRSRGSGARGLVVDAPAPEAGAPGAGLPNLAETRRVRTSPRTSALSSPMSTTYAPIQPSLPCADCDTGGGGAGGGDPYFGTSRGRPINRTGAPGVTLGSRNFNWGVPLVSLPGRAGLGLDVSLYYNSLVWTRQDDAVQFNADHGTPAPGFQLGLPRLQQKFIDEEITNHTGVATFAYTMVTPSGGRVKMAQTATAGVYESSDSTFTQLTEGAPTTVRTTDGTQYVFGAQVGAEWRCTQIKDRNGNYISAEYDMTTGHVTRITDTLGRRINFNYNAATHLLDTVTQTWGGAAHVYATFYYDSVPLAYHFSGLGVSPPSGGLNQTVLKSVVLSGSLDSYDFDYNSYGQVYRITHKAPDGHQLAYTRYNLSDADLNGAAQTDCPRFTERRDWAQTWNGDWDGVPAPTEEAATTYSVADGVQFIHPVSGSMTGTLAQETTPDGTVYKEYSLTTGWGAGLTQLSEVWSGGAVRKSTDNVWTQSDTSLPYRKNPRLLETNVRDLEGNRRRVTFEYAQSYLAFNLPWQVVEYAADGQTPLRRTITEYAMDSAYINSRVIGLPVERKILDGSWNTLARSQYMYDQPWQGYMASTPSAPTQHDEAAYGAGSLAGRGNLVWEGRFDATDPYNWDKVATRTFGYNQTGGVTFAAVMYANATVFDYADSFSDGANRNTYAYPTKVTDPEGYYSTAQYDYDFGAVTRTHTPVSGTTAAGVNYVDVTTQYDSFGRVELQTNLSTGAYRRSGYDPNFLYVSSYETLTGASASDEFHSWQVLDGAGRVRATAQDHPGSSTGFSGEYHTFDSMGRVNYTSNTAEIDASWNPAGDDAPNQQQNTGGWRYTSQTYDWKGRPLQTTNPDGTTRVASYGGCGCAGGEVTTEQDEHGRRTRYTKDALGRLSKTEELNWDGTVYSTTQYAHDALDHLRQITQQGQTRTLDYDGHGRLWRRTTPEQGTTTYAYNADDTVANVVDARGAKAVFTYNPRRMVTGVSYDLSGAPAGQNVQPTAPVAYAYDAAGNRTSMTDGAGASTYHYDNLGRMDSEQRTFAGTNLGPLNIGYEYNVGGELRSITNPWGVRVTYAYDRAGRLSSVGGANYAGVTSYADSMTYRAFGALKSMTYKEGPGGRPLYTAYDIRGRLTKWDAYDVLGYRYYYDDFNERTGRVTYAQRLTASTSNLDRTQAPSNAEDRSYEYDQTGRLIFSHSGAEAKAHAFTGQWGVMDGPYSQGYEYDQYGNMTHRYGWGGEVQGGSAGVSTDITYSYTNNRRNGFSYDASGNLTFDGGQHFAYDAAGRQVTSDYTDLHSYYDGDGLRAKKTEYGGSNSLLYLRSSVLGGQAVAELLYVNGSWQWSRGYVYSGGGSLLAVQQGGVFFVHEDAVTKSKRVTDTSGAVVSAVELDPYGADTYHSGNSSFQPRKFTSYERDANGTDDAMMRRYNRWHSRFDQPDPYDGSYDLADPQSFNRYSYVGGDPVNFVDPSGLMPRMYPEVFPEQWGAQYGWGNVSDGFWGYPDGSRRHIHFGDDIYDRWAKDPREFSGLWEDFTWYAWGGFFGAARQNPAEAQRAEQQRQQQEFDNCAKSHIIEFRRAERSAIAKIGIGTVATLLFAEAAESASAANVAFNGAVARAGARVIAYSSRYRAGQFLSYGGKLAGAVTGGMAIDGFRDSFANNAQVDKALEDCASKSPLADHSTFRHFLSNPF